MTKQEKLIVSAYTGVLMTDMSSLQEYIEQKLGRPVRTHELASTELWNELKAAVKEDFIKLCNTEYDIIGGEGVLTQV